MKKDHQQLPKPIEIKLQKHETLTSEQRQYNLGLWYEAYLMAEDDYADIVAKQIGEFAKQEAARAYSSSGARTRAEYRDLVLNFRKEPK